MTYVPASDRLTLDVNSAEPAGGLFVHFTNLPGLPPATLAFNGAGALDNFTAKLDLAAGADIWAKGHVVVARRGRRAAAHARPHLATRGPRPRRHPPVFAGETTLEGNVLFNDNSSIALPGGLHVVSASARLDFEGGKSADNQLGLKVHAGAIPGAEKIGKLDLDASIDGPLSGPKIKTSFDAGQIRAAEGSLGHVAATFRATPNGPLTDATTRIAFAGEAKLSGLALANPSLNQAVGPEVTLAVARLDFAGRERDFLGALDLAAPSLNANYAGLFSAAKIHGRLEVAARDLSRFALVAGNSLEGEARIAADFDGAPRYGALTATLDAHATHLESGYLILDRIIGGELSLTGGARSLTGGAARLQQSPGGRQARIGPARRRRRTRQGRSQRQNRCAAGAVSQLSRCRQG